MADSAVKNDTYLEGRQLEAQARQQNSASAWLAFAGIKASKGSYPLAAMGYMNAGDAHATAAEHEAAADAYEKGAAIAIKGKLKEAGLFLTSKLAALHERHGRYAQAAATYEKFADFCEAQQAWFLAADACEHAAEMMKTDGRDLSGYRRPAELWLRNAEYWVGKDAGDEAWSRGRAALYLEGIAK
ncbi:MAG: hypothetical protein KBH08_03835 [Brachymonas sp.]|jgi:tetratricopeptide (TPR) repeat protein|nr:hypothetical protein [Brachymonas sp.]MBP8794261.1 hypothetical protein [Brachymonas sp.]MBP8821211.1 hypothetical protein [Brachymonas sp.]MBP9651540.1 hypothetical protein [Brachymonas sp.]